MIPVAGKQGRFVIGLGTTLASLRWNLNEKTHKVVNLTTVDGDKPGNRWNDAKADVNGFLWAGECACHAPSFRAYFSKFFPNNARQFHSPAGTMGFEDAAGNIPHGRGTLYKLNDTSCFRKLDARLPDVTVSNGLAWNGNSTRMYYIDSPTRQIALFDYDPAAASMCKRVFLVSFFFIIIIYLLLLVF